MVRIRAGIFAVLVLSSLGVVPVGAQQPDSSRAIVADTNIPRERKPPLSASRAFLGSLILPGYSQSVLGRQRSGAMILAFETVSIIMLRESILGAREARRQATDSVLVSYVGSGGTLAPKYFKGGYSPALIRARKEQREDWTAVLIGTHLFAALDALVASVLWDLPAEMAVRGGPRAASVEFRLNF